MPVPSWDDFVVLAFDEIRYCGATSIQVMRRMRALLQDLKEHVRPDRRAALEYYLARVDKGIRRDFEDVDDSATRSRKTDRASAWRASGNRNSTRAHTGRFHGWPEAAATVGLSSRSMACPQVVSVHGVLSSCIATVHLGTQLAFSFETAQLARVTRSTPPRNRDLR